MDAISECPGMQAPPLRPQSLVRLTGTRCTATVKTVVGDVAEVAFHSGGERLVPLRALEVLRPDSPWLDPEQ